MWPSARGRGRKGLESSRFRPLMTLEVLVHGRRLDVRVRRAELNPAWLRLLGLGDVNLKHAVRVRSRDLRLVYTLGQASCARECAEPPLKPVEAVLFRRRCPLALAADSQRVVVNLDRDPFLVETREVERIDDLRVCLPDIE